MNLLDHYVLEVHGVEYRTFEDDEGQTIPYWAVSVTVDCYGRKSETEVVVFSEEEAYKITKGYVYQA